MGKEQADQDTIRFAETKLICKENLPIKDEAKRHAAELAILGVRLLMDFEPVQKAPSQNMEEALVERNMHIAYSVPKHHHYLQSGYLSEPILAKAAANLMRTLRTTEVHSEDCPDDRIAEILRRHAENGLVGKCEMGELTGRLLLILAMDLAQEAAQSTEGAKGIGPRWSKPVSIIDFIKSLIGSNNYDKHIKNSLPDNSSGEAFHQRFRNSVVRFTHFAQSDDDSGVTTAAAYAAFVRGLAVQCHPFQQSVNVAVPMLIDRSGPVEEKNMTILLISFKNRSRSLNVVNTAINVRQLGCFPDADPMEGDTEAMRPYISLVMELGVQMQVPSGPASVASRNCPTTSSTVKRSTDTSAAPPRKKPKTGPSLPPSAQAKIDSNMWAVRKPPKRGKRQPVNPHYRIRIRGCSPKVYGVVHDEDVYAHLLHTRPIFTEHARLDDDFLAAVRRLKPFFSEGLDGHGHWLHFPNHITKTIENAVMVDMIETGKPADEDLETEGSAE